MNSRDYFAKRVVLRKLAKTFCGKKIHLGPDLVGPTVGGGAAVRLTHGLGSFGGEERGRQAGPWRGKEAHARLD